MPSPTVTHRTFVLEHRYAASPERVFAHFSDSAKKRRWLGGEEEGFEIVSYEPNFAVETFERWQFRFQGGELIKNDTCYQDIVPARRVVFVYTMTFGGRRISSSQVTVEFLPDGTGTRLIHTEQGAFFDGADQAAGREHGTNELLKTLGKLVEAEA